MDDQELKNVLEAAMLAAGAPLTIERMLSLFPEGERPDRAQIRQVLAALASEYETRGIELREIDRGYRIQTRERYAPWINRLSEERPARYSRALLETLAIVAYRQPVTRADIEDIRGVGVSTEILKTLLGRGWIRQVGQKEVPGRPALYGTARGFLEYFNLRSLAELPPLAEVRALSAVAMEYFGSPAEEGVPTEDGGADHGAVGPGAETEPPEAVAHEASLSDPPA
ncbi:MAG: SMC-Scp complex subunit ScpB [Acidiferrobacteraceae bacterium]